MCIRDRVKVTDASGNAASSSFTLFTLSEVQPPAVLGGGSALALNYLGTDLTQARQYAVDLEASDTGTGATATIEAWVNATHLPDPFLNIIAVAGRPGQTAGLILAVQQDGSPSLANWLNDFYPTNATVKVTTNRRHHVAGVVNGQAVTLCVDGQVSARGILPLPMNLQPDVVYVGQEPPSDHLDRGWFGYLDNVRIWSTARSAADIAAYQQQAVPSDAPGLVRDFRCDDGFVHFDGANPGPTSGGVPVGGDLQDSSARQRHAPLVGLPAFVTGVPLGATVNVAEDVPATFGLGAAVDGTNVWGTAGVTREIYFGPVSATLGAGFGSSPGWPDQPDVVLASGLGLEMPPSGCAAICCRPRRVLTPSPSPARMRGNCGSAAVSRRRTSISWLARPAPVSASAASTSTPPSKPPPSNSPLGNGTTSRSVIRPTTGPTAARTCQSVGPYRADWSRRQFRRSGSGPSVRHPPANRSPSLWKSRPRREHSTKLTAS